MFNFKSKEDPIVTAVRDTIGSREKYIDFVKVYTLKKEEKDILLQASITVLKKDPNHNIIRNAYDILLNKGAITEDVKQIDTETEEEISKVQVDAKDDLISKSTDETENTKATREEQEIDKNLNIEHKSKKKYWIWGLLIFLLGLLSLSDVVSAPEAIIIGVIGAILFLVIIIRESAIKESKYYIYSNPQGDYKAVKEGWSWAAFIFDGLWALVNKMWILGIIFVALDIFAIFTTGGILTLFWSIVLGIQGNNILSKHLARRGYEIVAILHGKTAEEAIALFLKNTPKSPIMQTQSNEDKHIFKKENNNLSIADELKKLAILKEDGLLSEEEFGKQKQKLLNN